MADYNTGADYGNAFSRDYHPLDSEGYGGAPLYGGIGIEEMGISAPPMKDALQSLKAKIFQGARKVELGFLGKGKGSKGQGATTPEQIDSWARRDIRELAELNKVKVSTHATVGVGNLSGLSQSGFSDEEREKAMHELKKAIDFAAEATQGGAVVVHTGEFPRAMSEQEGWRRPDGKPLFLNYPTEAEHAKQYVVDGQTGRFIGEISKDQVVYEPKWMTARDMEEESARNGAPIKLVGRRDKYGREIKADDWVDLEGNVVPKDASPEELFNRRVPKWDPQNSRFVTERREWSYFKQKADEWKREHPDQPKTPAMIFYETQLDNRILQAKGQSLFYARNYDHYKQELKKVQEAYEEYQKLEKNIPEQNRWKIAVEKVYGGPVARLLPRENEMPTQALQRYIEEIKREMRFMHEAAASADAAAATELDMKKRLMPLEDYAKQKTADTIARAAEYAMAKSEKTKEPIYVSPENIWPESYGSHPEELRELILKSREAFAQRLLELKKVKSKEEAARLAERHIKATFDIGHANIWRKYFSGSDEEFRKWLVKEVEKLNKDRIIGHIHVSDNFGYDDEHVTPGRGNAPIKELLEKFREAGITDIIVEPAEQDYEAMLGAWGLSGGPIYGVIRGGLGWTDIEHSYFGRTAPPYFLYGDAAPSPQEWQLWSGVKLE